MKRKIRISLSPKSIDRAIKELEDYKKWIKQKAKELAEALAIVGAKEAANRFASAMYDGINDVHVTVEENNKGWVIKAQGQAVAFIEFGSGVWHNPGEPHPNRPPGIAKIGEYGQGKGKREFWFYYDDSGEKRFTRGNPANLGLWYAGQEMRDKMIEVAREVFSS